MEGSGATEPIESMVETLASGEVSFDDSPACVLASRPPLKAWMKNAANPDASARLFALDFDEQTLCVSTPTAEEPLSFSFRDLHAVAPLRRGLGRASSPVEEDILCTDVESLSRTSSPLASTNVDAISFAMEKSQGVLLSVQGEAPMELICESSEEAALWLEALRGVLATTKMGTARESTEASTAPGSKTSSRQGSPPPPVPELDSAKEVAVEEEEAQVIAIGSATSPRGGADSAWVGGRTWGKERSRYADKAQGMSINERLSQLVFSDDEDEETPADGPGQPRDGPGQRRDAGEAGDDVDGAPPLVTVETCEAFVQESNEDVDSDEEQC